MGRYLDMAKKFEAQRLAEVKTPDPLLHPSPDLWLCDQCGLEAEIEDVCRSVDGQRWLTLWCCRPCESYGVTPDTIRQPPKRFLNDSRDSA